MKRTGSIILLSIVVCIYCSCTRQPRIAPTLLSIQQMGDTSALEALKALERYKQQTWLSADQKQRYRIKLLEVRLKDKAYIPLDGVSEMESVCRYYREHGSNEEQAEAYYYLASTYRDLQDYPQAVATFEKIPSLCCRNALLLRNTYSQLSYIHSQQMNFEDALESAKKEYFLAERHHQLNATTVMDLATASLHLKDTVHSMKYCRKALDIILKEDSRKNYASVLGELLLRFAEAKDTSNVIVTMQELDNLPNEDWSWNTRYGIAAYYTLIGKEDSAVIVYSDMMEHPKSWGDIETSSRYLTSYYKERGNYAKGLEYAELNRIAYDSVETICRRELTAIARGENVYRRSIEKENQAIKKASRLQLTLLGSVLIFVVLLLLDALYYAYHKKKMLNLILEKDGKINDAHVILHKKEEQLQILENEVKAREELLQERQRQKDELMKMALMQTAVQRDAAIIDVFRRYGDGYGRATEEDWKKLLTLVDSLYPDFTKAVHTKLKRLNESKIRTCYLLKLGFGNPQIINIQDVARQTIWDRVKSLKESLGEDLSFDLDVMKKATSTSN